MIYKIVNDGFKYQELDLVVRDFIDSFPDEYDYRQCQDFSLENIALKDFWPTMQTGFSKIEGNENLIPDITTWIDATLLLSPRSFRLLGDMLKPFGELLPILVEGENYFLFNCLTKAEAVVEDEDTNRVTFDENKIKGYVAFKARAQHCFNVFCSERLKNAVEGFDLQGIIFEKLDSR